MAGYCLNIVIFVHTFSIKNLIYSEWMVAVEDENAL